jgi:hypothetical protein
VPAPRTTRSTARRTRRLALGVTALVLLTAAPAMAGQEPTASPTSDAKAAALELVPSTPQPEVSTAGGPGTGYWMLDVDGQVYDFGAADHFGEPAAEYGPYPDCRDFLSGATDYCDMAISIAAHPSGNGYWVLDTTGFIWNYGAAPELPARQAYADDPWMSVAPTASGNGLWAFSSLGCVDAIGDAQFHGDVCDQVLNAPVIGSAVTPTGNGYWLVAADGGIFSFGDARFYGSTGAIRLNQPVLGMAPTPTGNGYWLVAADGGIFAFGDAAFLGSMGGTALNRPVVGIVPSPTGFGYLMVAEDGGIFAFGDVPFHGSLGGNPPPFPVVAVATYPTGS